jgi:hypothetical protein
MADVILLIFLASPLLVLLALRAGAFSFSFRKDPTKKWQF